MIIRFLKNVFGAIALFLFAMTIILVCPLFAICFLILPEKFAPQFAHQMITRNWARLANCCFCIHAKIKNKDFIDPGTSYVFVANHRSLLDAPFFALSCGNTFRFLVKAELAKIPLMGFIVRKLCIYVNRTDKADRNAGLESVRKSLADGISVFICPEGTRNRKMDPPLLEMRDGSFRIAIATKTPLAVLTILNAGEKLSPNHPIELTPGTIHAIWDKPIDTSQMTLDDVPALRERVRAIMLGHLLNYRKTASSQRA